MIKLRKLFLFFLFLIFVIALRSILLNKSKPQVRNYFSATSVPKPCRKPLQYAVGSVDSRFNISPEEFKTILSEAEAMWENNSGYNLFEYAFEAELEVSLVYDERQQQTYDAERMESSLKTLDEQRKKLDDQQSVLSSKYDKKFSDFKKAVEKYEDRVEEYNEKVSLWNSEGGTSEEEYNDLKEEEKSIREEFKKLKDKEEALNDLAKEANAILEQENKIIRNYNVAVTTYKSKFGNSQEFEKGIFDPSAGIAIYQFEEISDLRLTLIHELGHSLGVSHVDNPKSIMYYLMGEQDLENPQFTAEDMLAVKTTCQFD